MTDKCSRDVAAALLRIGAVEVSIKNPFRWASGLLSPVYCDNRKIMSFPDVRAMIVRCMVEKVDGSNFNVIAGTATAGIPPAAFLSAELDVPMIYVRSKAKEHGRGNQIEGVLTQGQRVLLIEDLVSTGMSSLNAVAALRDAGAEVEVVLSIFTYGLKSAERNFLDANVLGISLSDFPSLVHELGDGLSHDYRRSLLAWFEDPERWSAEHGGGTG